MKSLLALLVVGAPAVSGVLHQEDDLPIPTVHRLDLALHGALDAAATPPGDADVARVRDVLVEHRDVYARLGHDAPEAYASILLSDHEIARDVSEARRFFRRRDLTEEVTRAWLRTADALGARPEAAPEFWLAHGWKNGTNAQTAGATEADPTVRVFLNLPALAVAKHWDAAIVHESVHTLQPPMDGRTLLDRAVYEGVATYVSKRLVKRLPDHDAVFWSKEAWRAADKRRDAILERFEALQDATEQREIGSFLFLNVPLEGVPGAPDRCAYFVGFLAAEAWMEADRKRTLADLVAAEPAALWAALAASER